MMTIVNLSPNRVAPPDLERWYRTHAADLVRLATMWLGDQSAAEEIVQDTFARLHQRPPDLEDPSKAAPYLRSAVLNRCRSHVRRRQTGRRATVRLTGRADQRTTAPAAEGAGIDAAGRREVLAAVRQLPGRQRDCVLLRYWLDLSEADTADTLGISVGTVKSSTHRALKALSPQLEALR